MEVRKVNEELPHSVEISINAKLQYSAKCKVYGDTPENALEKSKEISKKLEELIIAKNKL